jgi:hypothetical protein
MPCLWKNGDLKGVEFIFSLHHVIAFFKEPESLFSKVKKSSSRFNARLIFNLVRFLSDLQGKQITCSYCSHTI